MRKIYACSSLAFYFFKIFSQTGILFFQMEYKESESNYMNRHNFNQFYPFLKAVKGNWHNALYIGCPNGSCQYGGNPCHGFLLAADAEGLPILMPVDFFKRLTGEDVEAEGCKGRLRLKAFQSAFSSYIEWHTDSASECPLLQLCQIRPEPFQESMQKL